MSIGVEHDDAVAIVTVDRPDAMNALDVFQAKACGALGHETARLLETMPQPTIAAINGFALGAAASSRSPATCASPRRRRSSVSRRSTSGSSRGGPLP